MGRRFQATNIIPVLRDAWSLPELDVPNAYYSNQPIGRMYARLALDTPSSFASPLTSVAQTVLSEAFSRCVQHYRRFGDAGLTTAIHAELRRAEAYLRRLSARVSVMANAR